MNRQKDKLDKRAKESEQELHLKQEQERQKWRDEWDGRMPLSDPEPDLADDEPDGGEYGIGGDPQE